MNRKSVLTLVTVLFIFLSARTATATNSINEIKAEWNRLKPRYTGETFIEKPSVKAPYATGRLAIGFLQDGLNMANFIRYLAGLPSDLELDDELCVKAQYGAVLTAASSEYSHQPARPAGMSQSFYEIGLESTTSSNLFKGYNSTLHLYGNPFLRTKAYECTAAESVVTYMADRGNRDTMGHRRWILNPQLKKTGFGFAGTSSVMPIMGYLSKEYYDYDFVAWPNEGYAPINFLASSRWVTPFNEQFDTTIWTVSPNPAKYRANKTDNIKVTMTRLTDGYQWELDSGSNKVKKTNDNWRYFKVDQQGYGVPFCIMFKPDNITKYNAGETFRVQITGLTDKNGNEAEISYSVTMFDLERPNPVTVNVNGNPVLGGPVPLIVDGRTIIPLRAIFEALGATVQWDEYTQTVTATRGATKVVITIGSRVATVNGVTRYIDVPAQVINNRTMVPVRFVSEGLGAKVEWDEASQTVFITK